jgi:hypothetical protein
LRRWQSGVSTRSLQRFSDIPSLALSIGTHEA